MAYRLAMVALQTFRRNAQARAPGQARGNGDRRAAWELYVESVGVLLEAHALQRAHLNACVAKMRVIAARGPVWTDLECRALWPEPRELAAEPPAADAVGEPRQVTAGLTRREREIAVLIADGLSNREIAERLVVSVGTIQNHVHRMLKKHSLRSRAQLAVLAVNTA